MNKIVLTLRNLRILNNKNFFSNSKNSRRSLSLLNNRYRSFSTNNNENEPESHEDFKPKSKIKPDLSEEQYNVLIDSVNSFYYK